MQKCGNLFDIGPCLKMANARNSDSGRFITDMLAAEIATVKSPKTLEIDDWHVDDVMVLNENIDPYFKAHINENFRERFPINSTIALSKLDQAQHVDEQMLLRQPVKKVNEFIRRSLCVDSVVEFMMKYLQAIQMRASNPSEGFWQQNAELITKAVDQLAGIKAEDTKMTYDFYSCADAILECIATDSSPYSASQLKTISMILMDFKDRRKGFTVRPYTFYEHPIEKSICYILTNKINEEENDA